MNTFKAYFHIVRAKPWSFLLPIAIFGLMILLLSSSLGDTGTDKAVINYSYMIEGETPEGFEGLLAYLEENGQVREYEDEDALRRSIFDDVSHFAFIVSGDDYRSVPQGAPESRFAAMQRVKEYVVYRDLLTEYDVRDQEGTLQALLDRETLIETPGARSDRPLLMMQQYFNFTSYITMLGLFNIMMVVSTVFNKPDFLRRNLISATPYDALQRGILMGHLVIVLVVYLLLVAGATLLYGPSTVTSPEGLKMILGFALYTLCIALLGFFITRVVNNLQVGSMITNVLALGMSFISGAFVATEFLSAPVIKASQVFPMYWFIRGNELALQGSPDYWKGLLVILLMCVVLFALIFVADFRRTRTATTS